MKKTLMLIAAACVVVISLTSYNLNPTGNRLGYIAPNFTAENDMMRFELQQSKGNYVLLTFWSSVDAESRIANVQYDRAVKELEGVEFISVNFDRSYGVYREMLKIDGVNTAKQFYDCKGEDGNLYLLYGLKRGMKSLLLDKTGKVVAENPNVNDLRNLIE